MKVDHRSFIDRKEGDLMKFSSKGEQSFTHRNQMFGVNFHDFIQREATTTPVELASEFGLTLRDVQALKKNLSRS